MLRAFLVGDEAAFRQQLGLEPWQDTPLADRTGHCTQGHPIAGPGPVGHGCRDQHEAHALRSALIAEIERLGAFRFAALDDLDDEVARVAWGRLARAAEEVGVPEEKWTEVLRAAGWEGWWEEEDPND
ncbi:MAG TPA: hypothetical protein VGV13_14855 [Methylomirabilota bacterium]|jgi:hypothetical protein|nr:hypothetical protein [Methylomirabilota bacterium]